eukprot:CAMPEP_0179481168 /NCGR_PEP_ID=MMETSP0799-20121207/58966_1 /TAXON_ID=46947 /ORGANISM="Geminigera cryophila, Strain CCMP2564" /LENGTH=126 /DNA_ID=CAMNT_0021293645 /DNA_START=112 /DNA_END=488 /DNA_ORIENTATION=-
MSTSSLRTQRVCPVGGQRAILSFYRADSAEDLEHFCCFIFERLMKFGHLYLELCFDLLEERALFLVHCCDVENQGRDCDSVWGSAVGVEEHAEEIPDCNLRVVPDNEEYGKHTQQMEHILFQHANP